MSLAYESDESDPESCYPGRLLSPRLKVLNDVLRAELPILVYYAPQASLPDATIRKFLSRFSHRLSELGPLVLALGDSNLQLSASRRSKVKATPLEAEFDKIVSGEASTVQLISGTRPTNRYVIKKPDPHTGRGGRTGGRCIDHIFAGDGASAFCFYTGLAPALGGAEFAHHVLCGRISYVKERDEAAPVRKKPNLARLPPRVPDPLDLAKPESDRKGTTVDVWSVFDARVDAALDAAYEAYHESRACPETCDPTRWPVPVDIAVCLSRDALMQLGRELLAENQGTVNASGRRMRSDVEKARRLPAAVMRVMDQVRDAGPESAAFALRANGEVPPRYQRGGIDHVPSDLRDLYSVGNSLSRPARRLEELRLLDNLYSLTMRDFQKVCKDVSFMQFRARLKEAEGKSAYLVEVHKAYRELAPGQSRPLLETLPPLAAPVAALSWRRPRPASAPTACLPNPIAGKKESGARARAIGSTSIRAIEDTEPDGTVVLREGDAFLERLATYGDHFFAYKHCNLRGLGDLFQRVGMSRVTSYDHVRALVCPSLGLNPPQDSSLSTPSQSPQPRPPPKPSIPPSLLSPSQLLSLYGCMSVCSSCMYPSLVARSGRPCMWKAGASPCRPTGSRPLSSRKPSSVVVSPS